MGYAVVLGDAPVGLLDTERDAERAYRQAAGAGPLDVAVGVARLGGRAQFVGSPGVDDLDVAVVEGADVLCCGSVVLRQPGTLAAARRAWSLATGLRVLDADVSPRPPDGLREVVAEFAAGAHLVTMSTADARLLYPGEPVEGVAAYLRELGAATVVVTLGAAGAVLAAAGADPVRVPTPRVDAVDTTGAGDAMLAALVADLLASGEPDRPDGWVERVAFALRVAGLVCESPAGATAKPTRADVGRRFGGQAAPSSSR
ncbi:PfkB family carbohydrate kinase [Micromonospora profundi]|uniref:PfkB family carbohydrate kinase n=1 Tax=Micromonospora profundi TaxID=1420889 RepID=A0AAJ6HLQ0_9ACTN|nr:PfkB family carbohydrate kinase [Micromonospora profundi]WLS43115.1 PfkB family carbohydrate kinase [Micromonospora profundi]